MIGWGVGVLGGWGDGESGGELSLVISHWSLGGSGRTVIGGEIGRAVIGHWFSLCEFYRISWFLLLFIDFLILFIILTF
jgi:hypothetical protein